jgi:hypothetical protein
MPGCPVPSGHRRVEGTFCQSARVLCTAGHEIGLTQFSHERASPASGLIPHHDLIEQMQGLGDPPGHCIRQTQTRHNLGQVELDVSGATVGVGGFEHGHGTLEISLLEDEMPEPGLREDRTAGVSGCAGNAGRFFAPGNPLGKLPQLCQAAN